MEITQLIQQFGLTEQVQRYKLLCNEYENFVVLNYDQLNSDKTSSVIMECRALILDKKDWRPLCRSFDRFFNYGEDKHSNKYPFEECIISSKEDGSLISFWWNPYDEQWQASTRKMAYLNEALTPRGNTWESVVEKALGRSVKDFGGDKEFTYMCELVSPETRVVTPYADTKLYLLGMRFLQTGHEYIAIDHLDMVAKELGLERPKIFNFKSVDKIIHAANSLPELQEGFVCAWMDKRRDKVWRLKIKNINYLEVSRRRNNGILTEKRILDMFFDGDIDEYLSYFPEDKEYFNKILYKFENLKSILYKKWLETKDIESQKDFALRIKDLPYSSILFKLRQNLALDNILLEYNRNSLLEMMNKIGEK